MIYAPNMPADVQTPRTRYPGTQVSFYFYKPSFPLKLLESWGSQPYVSYSSGWNSGRFESLSSLVLGYFWQLVHI
jgi:hypothetical protein